MDLLNQQLMMLDIDGVLTHHHATPIDVLTAAQALAVSAIGDIINKSQLIANNCQSSIINFQLSDPSALHRFADLAADQIREALHKRIDEGARPDW